MRLSVIGCGYLGAVHAASMTTLGHEVVGIDVDPAKIKSLSAGIPPFHEPGFDEILAEALATGRLSFATDMSAAAGAQVHFVCVGTPQLPGGTGADLTYVHSAVDALIPLLAQHPDGPVVVVGKSTVPVGTAQGIADRVEAALPDGAGMVIWNPEFLREGFAVKDTLEPDRIVYGLPNSPWAQSGKEVLDAVYAEALERKTPLVVGDYATAELVKVSANSFLATKISFINAMAEICEATGADVTVLAEAIGLDERIGSKFLKAGIGFGGGCLPKDIRAFMTRADEIGVGDALSFLREVDDVNSRRRSRVVDIATQACGGSVEGHKIAVLGASFKPNTDDLRDSPAIDIAARLEDLGADVVVTDPQALKNVTAKYPKLQTAATALEAATGAELVLLLTEWSEYVDIDPTALGSVVSQKWIVDGRNSLDAGAWRDAGWTYSGMGRP